MADEPATEVAHHPNIDTALAAFQRDLPKVGKDNTARVTSDKGSYTYRYADLSEISPLVLPLLARHGLSWRTLPTLTDDDVPRFVLAYTLAHETGGKVEGLYPLPNPGSSPQVLGGAITYARRYCLCAVTGVAPGDDDDDAAAATRAHEEQQQRRQERAQRPQAGPARPGAGGTGQPANGAHTAIRPAPGGPSAEPIGSTKAALDLLRESCAENRWSLDRVAALYAERHGGSDIRTGSMREIEAFRKSLFAMSDSELRDPEPAADEAPAEPAPSEEADQ